MADALDSPVYRREFLALLAAASAAACSSAVAGEDLIGRLIEQSRGFPALPRRIEFISSALIGKRYRADTLIGGPRQKEIFVTRDDAFDCVTYCETVLAAAQARDLPAFNAALREIRYRNGAVEWRERNHDFAVWSERNVANGQCQPVTVGSTVEVKKSISLPSELGQRNYSIAAVPRTVLLAHQDKVANGDIMGFVSLRPSLDYYHCGFVMRDGNEELLLRHASLSHGRVVDQRLAEFIAVNRVRYVTVLRPQARAA